MSVAPPLSGGNLADDFLAPRALAYFNGIFLPSWDIEVEQTAYNVTDTFTIKTPLGSAPMDFGAFTQNNTNPIPMTISVGAQSDPTSYVSTAFDQLMYGFCDELDSDYDNDVIEFKGRGVLSLLADGRTTQRVKQNVDVQVALTSLIEGVGLKAQVNNGQPSGVSVGRIMQDDFVMIGRNLRIVEYMQTLATGVGWIMRSRGQTVIVGPPPDRNTVPVFTKIHGQQGDTSLRIRHSALHAHDIKVRVVSYIPKQKTRVTSGSTAQPGSAADVLTGMQYSSSLGAPTPTSPAKAKVVSTGGQQKGVATGGFSFSRAEEYVFHIPGLTSQQADAQAALIQAEISRHEFVAELTFTPTASELRMLVQNSPEFLVNLQGCSQSSHNQMYHPRKVTWTYSLDEGLKVALLMVNHDVPVQGGE